MGWQRREAGPLRSQLLLSQHPQTKLPECKDITKGSIPDADPLTHWNGPQNIAQVRINDESCWALLGNGSTINTVTPEFVKALSLDIGPLSHLVEGRMGINGFGGVFSQPWGYIIVRAQVEGV